jgi:hypothetical protein
MHVVQSCTTLRWSEGPQNPTTLENYMPTPMPARHELKPVVPARLKQSETFIADGHT